MTEGGQINIVLVYRPPSSTVENIQKLCMVLRQLDQNSTVIGDFNLPGIDWKTMKSDAKGRILAQTVEEEGLEQLVNFKTHIKGNILDLVLANHDDIVSVEEIGRLGRSDHSIIKIEIQAVPLREEISENSRGWRRADWEGMKKLLSQNR